MTDYYTIDRYAIELLAGRLLGDFRYLLNRELAEKIATQAIQTVAQMQEYSGNRVWRTE